jgi:hypothetical protein
MVAMLDRERSVREEHATRVREIDALLSRGAVEAAEAQRLRAAADRERDDALQRLGSSYLKKKNRRMVGAPAKKGKKGAPAGKPQPPPPPYVGAAAAAAAPAAGLKKNM